VLLSYRSPKYKNLPAYVYPGWSWNAHDEAPPATVVSFKDSNDDFLLAAFWPADGATEFGLFPLGSGDDRLEDMPMADDWEAKDTSLSSIGVVPGGKITLCPPLLAERYLDDLLTTAGLPATPANVHAVGLKVGELFLIKAFQFISSQDQRASDRFGEGHRFRGGPLLPFCQSVLDDLAAYDFSFLPYVQELPMRVRALLLEDDNVRGILDNADRQ
jgi:hypothetical protein